MIGAHYYTCPKCGWDNLIPDDDNSSDCENCHGEGLIQ